MKTSFGEHVVEINPLGDEFVALLGTKSFRVQVLRSADGELDLLLDGKRFRAIVSVEQARRWITCGGHTIMLTKTSGAKQGVRHEHAGELAAPMPGQVQSVAVHAGDVVKKGQTLLTIEAMKMEIRIQALTDGRVKTVHVAQNQTVEREQVLIEMEE